MAGSRNNIANRGAKQANRTVLVITTDAKGKTHKRFVHDSALHAEVEGHLAQPGGRR